MAVYYFPSCKVTAQFIEASQKAKVERFPHMVTPMEPYEQIAHCNIIKNKIENHV